MSSVLGSNGCPQQVAYAAAKQGVIGLTKSAALLLSDHASFITGSYHLVDGGYAVH